MSEWGVVLKTFSVSEEIHEEQEKGLLMLRETVCHVVRCFTLTSWHGTDHIGFHRCAYEFHHWDVIDTHSWIQTMICLFYAHNFFWSTRMISSCLIITQMGRPRVGSGSLVFWGRSCSVLCRTWMDARLHSRLRFILVVPLSCLDRNKPAVENIWWETKRLRKCQGIGKYI